MLSPRRLALAILGVGAFTVAFIAACGLSVTGVAGAPIDLAEAGEGATLPPRGDGEAEVDAGPRPPPCPKELALPGPEMVESPRGDFCIDATEITIAQYSVFLDATGGDAGFDGGMPAECFPHDDFKPVPEVLGSKNLPIKNVSWCDAFAYCKWAGKHICGGRLVADAGQPSEWFRACSRDGEFPVPYGTTPDTTSCVVSEIAAKEVASKQTCTGGYPGVFDMVGNVGEWVDDCTAAGCIRAGGLWSNGASATCVQGDRVPRRDNNDGAGIRCCR